MEEIKDGSVVYRCDDCDEVLDEGGYTFGVQWHEKYIFCETCIRQIIDIERYYEEFKDR